MGGKRGQEVRIVLLPNLVVGWGTIRKRRRRRKERRKRAEGGFSWAYWKLVKCLCEKEDNR